MDALRLCHRTAPCVLSLYVLWHRAYCAIIVHTALSLWILHCNGLYYTCGIVLCYYRATLSSYCAIIMRLPQLAPHCLPLFCGFGHLTLLASQCHHIDSGCGDTARNWHHVNSACNGTPTTRLRALTRCTLGNVGGARSTISAYTRRCRWHTLDDVGIHSTISVAHTRRCRQRHTLNDIGTARLTHDDIGSAHSAV